jgi:glutaredoxin-dependent peroxiredoxin
MRNFQQNLQKLEAADTQVLGVSMDSPFANYAFAQQNGVTFPLLSDMSGDAVKEYGLLNPIDVKGVKIDSARRATFLIDKDGKVEELQVDREAVDPAKIVTICERKKKPA